MQLNSGIMSAEALLDRAAQAGMEVSRAKFDLNGARDNLVDARVLGHELAVLTLQELGRRLSLFARDVVRREEVAHRFWT